MTGFFSHFHHHKDHGKHQTQQQQDPAANQETADHERHGHFDPADYLTDAQFETQFPGLSANDGGTQHHPTTACGAHTVTTACSVRPARVAESTHCHAHAVVQPVPHPAQAPHCHAGRHHPTEDQNERSRRTLYGGHQEPLIQMPDYQNYVQHPSSHADSTTHPGSGPAFPEANVAPHPKYAPPPGLPPNTLPSGGTKDNVNMPAPSVDMPAVVVASNNPPTIKMPEVQRMDPDAIGMTAAMEAMQMMAAESPAPDAKATATPANAQPKSGSISTSGVLATTAVLAAAATATVAATSTTATAPAPAPAPTAPTAPTTTATDTASEPPKDADKMDPQAIGMTAAMEAMQMMSEEGNMDMEAMFGSPPAYSDTPGSSAVETTPMPQEKPSSTPSAATVSEPEAPAATSSATDKAKEKEKASKPEAAAAAAAAAKNPFQPPQVKTKPKVEAPKTSESKPRPQDESAGPTAAKPAAAAAGASTSDAPSTSDSIAGLLGAGSSPQDKLIALAIAQAAKLFDKKNGKPADPAATQMKIQALNSAATSVLRLASQYRMSGRIMPQPGEIQSLINTALSIF